MRDNYNALLLSGVMLLGVSQMLEGMTTSTAQFFHGVLIAMSIACSLLGLVLYAQSTKKG